MPQLDESAFVNSSLSYFFIFLFLICLILTGELASIKYTNLLKSRDKFKKCCIKQAGVLIKTY